MYRIKDTNFTFLCQTVKKKYFKRIVIAIVECV